MNTYLLQVLVIAVAFGLSLGVLLFMRRDRTRQGVKEAQADGEVRILGAYSPVVTWLTKKLWPDSLHAVSGSWNQARDWMAAPRVSPEAGVSLGALGMAIFAQAWLVVGSPANALPPILVYCGAMALLIWSDSRLRQAQATSAVAYQPTWPARGVPRLGLVVTSVVLNLWTALNVTRDQSYLVDVTWVLSLVLLAGSALYLTGWEPPTQAAVKQWWWKHWLETVALVAVGVVSLGLGLYDLEVHPFSIANDEGEHGVSALGILSGEQQNLFNQAYGAVPSWSVLSRALAIRVFGNTVFGLRFSAAVEGALTVMMLYLLGREVFNRKIAALAIGVFMTMPLQLQFSRLGIANSALFFYAVLLVWLTYRALHRGRLFDYVLVGVASGLTLYCYAGTRVLIGLPIGTLGYVALRQRDYVRKHFVHLLAVGLGLLMAALPVILWFQHYPEVFAAQFNGHGILSNGWLAAEAASRPGGVMAVLLDQFQRSSLVYILTPSAGFYVSPKPFLTSLGSIFFMLGIGYSIGHWKEPRYVTLLAWLGGAIIAGTLTDLPPASERLILSSGAVALLVAVGLYQIADQLRQTLGASSVLRNVVCAAVVGVLAYQGLTFYFVDYRIHNYYEDHTNEITYESGQYAAALGPNYRMFLIGNGSPQVLDNFADFHYLAPEAHTLNFNDVNDTTLAALPRNVGAFFVAVPSKLPDLQLVSRTIPGGHWFQVQRRFHPEQVSYYGYVVSPAVMARR
jgi:hypothetical protein